MELKECPNTISPTILAASDRIKDLQYKLEQKMYLFMRDRFGAYALS